MKSRSIGIILALGLAGALLAVTSAVVVTSARTSAPPMTISVDGPTEAIAGQPFSYTLAITNNLSISATNVVITNRLPLNSRHVSGGTLIGEVVSWTVPNLSAGERISRQFSIVATETLTNSDYAVSSSEGYYSAGEIAVVTKVTYEIALPVILRDYCRDAFGDYFDDFNDPNSGWYVGNDTYVRSEYLNGEFRVLTKNPDYFYLYSAPTCARQNYIVEVDARWVGETGSSYGLLFGLNNDFSRYYLFDVNTDYRLYRVYRRDPNGWTVVVSVAESKAIKRGTAVNHLKVTRSASHIMLEVNGTVLGTWNDGAISGRTEVGIMTSPYSKQKNSDARFDNYRLTLLTTSASANAQSTTNLVNSPDTTIPHDEENAIHINLNGLPNWIDSGR